MSEILTKVVVDCSTGISEVIPLSAEEIAQIKSELITQKLAPGAVFHTPPCTIHRMVAYDDLHYTEASTTQLDDVIRLEDSANRGHGRIAAEHEQH